METFGVARSRDRLVVPQHLPGGRFGQPRKHAQQRRFPRARRTQQRQDFSRIHAQIQRRDHLNTMLARFPVELLQLSCFNQRLRHTAIIAAAFLQFHE